MMNIWKVNQENVITIVGSNDSLLTAYYVIDNTDNNFTQIPGTFSFRDGRYYLRCTFTTPGNYIIKVIDENGKLADMYSKLTVAAEDYQSLVNLYKHDTTEIKGSLSNLSTLVNQIPTYNDIDVLAGLTTEEHNKLMSLSMSPSDIWTYSNRSLTSSVDVSASVIDVLNSISSKVISLDSLKWTQPEKTQLLTLVNYDDSDTQSKLNYIQSNLGLTNEESGHLLALQNISASDIWTYSNRSLTTQSALTTEQDTILRDIQDTVGVQIINYLTSILHQDALLADKDDVEAIQNTINLIKSKTDVLTNYNDSSISSTLGQINDKVTTTGTKVDSIETKVTSIQTNGFTEADRTKLNSLENYDDSSLALDVLENQALLNSVVSQGAKETSVQQVKAIVSELDNYDDSTIINMLNNLPMLPAIKQEMINVQFGRLVIDPVLNKMTIYDKGNDTIIAEYMLYDNNGQLNSSRVFRREPL